MAKIHFTWAESKTTDSAIIHGAALHQRNALSTVRTKCIYSSRNNHSKFVEPNPGSPSGWHSKASLSAMFGVIAAHSGKQQFDLTPRASPVPRTSLWQLETSALGTPFTDVELGVISSDNSIPELLVSMMIKWPPAAIKCLAGTSESLRMTRG
jgi:hypothetical protein